MIDSGRSVALDFYAIGSKVLDDDPIGLLFQTVILNKSVILKQNEKILPKANKSSMFDENFLQQFDDGRKTDPPVNVNTVIYIPYDFENAYGGGESDVYRGEEFIKMLAKKVAQGEPSADLVNRLRSDAKILDLLDSMHSLDPFLFRSKAEQYSLEDRFTPITMRCHRMNGSECSAQSGTRLRNSCPRRLLREVTKGMLLRNKIMSITS